MLLFSFFACSSEVVLRDDLRSSTSISDDEPVALSGPYREGSTFGLAVHGSAGALKGLSLRSTDRAVLSVDDEGQQTTDNTGEPELLFQADAMGAGVTEIVVENAAGEELLRTEIEVREANRVELIPLALSLVDPTTEAVELPQLVAGFESAFLVNSFDDDQVLAGVGAMDARSDIDVFAIVQAESYNGSVDVLRIDPDSEGEHAVEFWNIDAKHAFATAAIVAVHPDIAISSGIVAPDETGAETGEELYVAATAFDADGESVFGSEFTWGHDGEGISGIGDLYAYPFDPNVTTEVVTGIRGRGTEGRQSVEIHGEGEVVQAPMACAVANVGPIGSAIALALIGAAKRRKVAGS